MAMKCDKCGNEEAFRISFSKSSISCDKCGDNPKFRFPDVYFRKPYFDPQIAHPDHSPKGTFIESRGHKAALMQQLGIREAA